MSILDIRFLLSIFSLFPTIVGLIKYNKIDKKFLPFIYMMWSEVIVEIINYLCKKNPSISNFQYIGMIGYMMLYFYWFLKLANTFNFLTNKKRNWLFIIAIIILGLNIILKGINDPHDYLLYYVSIIQLIISIDILSEQIMNLKNKWIDNFWIWMSSASILYNAITLLVFGLNLVLKVTHIGFIENGINIIYFILSGIAIIKIKTKQSPAINYSSHKTLAQQ